MAQKKSKDKSKTMRQLKKDKMKTLRKTKRHTKMANGSKKKKQKVRSI